MSHPLPTSAFDTVAALLKSRSGLVIGTDKLYLLETRLAAILKREKLRDMRHWPNACGRQAATQWRATLSRQ
jgi:hypothetical protein